jgi:hypothetical protein
MAIGGEKKEKEELRPKNELARSSFVIWPFGRLHTSRFR